MSFLNITFKATNIEITAPLQTLIEQKIQLLEKLITDHETDVRCEIEVEKLSEHVSGRIYRIEANLSIGGKLYRAEATEDQCEKAVDIVRNELKRELQHARGKKQSLLKRGGHALKNMLRRGS